MNPSKFKKEGVLFIFMKNGQILLEERTVDGKTGDYIPGGRCEPEDYESEDYLAATLHREVKEELGVTVLKYHFLGSYPFNNYTFHACMVDEWQGELPTEILDNARPIHWQDANLFIPSIGLEPLRLLLETHAYQANLGKT